MKHYILFGLGLTMMTACSSVPHHEMASASKVGMPNPASEYCVEQGGKLDIKNEANGQVGYCHLPTGQVIEEWEFFRASQEVCLPDAAKKLEGQSGLTDEQIKKLTHAAIIRSVAPNQPVTMDYRNNRVTVVIDPETQKIVRASCG